MLYAAKIVLGLLLGLFLPQLTGGCVRKPWEDGLINQDLLSFHCSYGYFMECEDIQMLEDGRIGRDLRHVCGIVLNCSTGSVHRNFYLSYVFHELGDYFGDVVLKATNCGVVRVSIEPLFPIAHYEFYLYFPHNEIHDLSDISIHFPGYCRSLNLTGNLLESLSLIPRDLQRIKVADFSNNNIQLVSSGCLSESKNLKWLSLANNRITTVPKLKIQNTSDVTLILRDNVISTIEENAFDDVMFDLLDLGNNSLTVITRAMFTVVERVTTLRLDNNHITWLEQGSFADTGVVELDLSSNSLFTIPDKVFSDLSALKSLKLPDNRIQSVVSPAPFDNCVALEYLDLSKNFLENIPSGIFQNLPRLRGLVLSLNRIATVEENSFVGLKLSLLDFSTNPLKVIEKNGFRETEVTHLNLSTCDFLEFPLSAIRVLGESLREVDLSRNRIDVFPNVHLGKAVQFESLDLSHNLINNINCSWLGDSLQSLYLHNNRISYIERCLFTERMFSVTRVSLRNNPLDCCELEWLHHITSNDNSTLLDAAETTCVTPSGEHLWEEGLVDTEKDCPSAGISEHNGAEGKLSQNNKGQIVGAVLGTFFGTICLLGVTGLIVWVFRKRVAGKKPTTNESRHETQLSTITEDSAGGYETVEAPSNAPNVYDELQQQPVATMATATDRKRRPKQDKSPEILYEDVQ